MIETMIPFEELRAVRTLVTHAHCPDGFASALLIKDALPHVEIYFVTHDQLKAMPAEPGMLFCDIAPSLERAEEFLKAGAWVLDHHKSVEEIEKLGGVIYSAEPGVSGAVLAFRHVWRPLKGNSTRPAHVMRAARAQWLATLIGIRDTFQKDSPEWDRACDVSAAIMYHGALLGDPTLFDLDIEWAGIESFGFLLRQNGRERTKQLARDGFKITTHKGTNVLIVQGLQTTELGEFTEGSAAVTALGFESSIDLVVGFMYRANEKGERLFQVSMRSQGKIDVRRIAEMYGGGGHTNAAGFTLAERDSPPAYASYNMWGTDPISAIEWMLETAEV